MKFSLKKLLLVVAVIGTMAAASIPVSANLSRSQYGFGDNVGMYDKYNWSITMQYDSGYASGYYMSGNGNVHCYVNTTWGGYTQSTQTYSNSIYQMGQGLYGGVDFYDF